MTLKELKDKLNTIPTEFNDYEVNGLFSDYEVDNTFKDVDVTVYMGLKELRLFIKR